MIATRWVTKATVLALVATALSAAVTADATPPLYELAAGDTLELTAPLSLNAKVVRIDGIIQASTSSYDLVITATDEVVIAGSIHLGQAIAPADTVAPFAATGSAGQDGGDLIIRAPRIRILETATITAGSGSVGGAAFAGPLFAPMSIVELPSDVTAIGGIGGEGGRITLDATTLESAGAFRPGAGGAGGLAIATGYPGIAEEAPAALATGGDGGPSGSIHVPAGFESLVLVGALEGAVGGDAHAFGGPGWSPAQAPDYTEMVGAVQGIVANRGSSVQVTVPTLADLITFTPVCSNGSTPSEQFGVTGVSGTNAGAGGNGATGSSGGGTGGSGCKGGTGGAATGTGGNGANVAAGTGGNGGTGSATGGRGGTGGVGGQGGVGSSGSCGFFGDTPGGTGGRGGDGGPSGPGGRGKGVGGNGGSSSAGVGGNGGNGIGNGGTGGQGGTGGRGGNGGGGGDPGGNGGRGGDGGPNDNGGPGEGRWGYGGTGTLGNGASGQATTTATGGAPNAFTGAAGLGGSGGPDDCWDGNGGAGSTGSAGNPSTTYGSTGTTFTGGR